MQFSQNTTPSEAREILAAAGVGPSVQNDFMFARNPRYPGHAQKKAEMIQRFPILSDFDRFLTSIGR